MDHLAESSSRDHLAIHEMFINAPSVFPDTFVSSVCYLGRKEVVCCSRFTPYDQRTTTLFPTEYSLRIFLQGGPILCAVFPIEILLVCDPVSENACELNFILDEFSLCFRLPIVSRDIFDPNEIFILLRDKLLVTAYLLIFLFLQNMTFLDIFEKYAFFNCFPLCKTL